MGTITISIDDETEKRFREVARRRIGDRKGSLGKATTEALELWIRAHTQEEIARDGLALLGQGFDFGKRKYRTRDDLYG
jgi:predicted transcriptional regulator